MGNSNSAEAQEPSDENEVEALESYNAAKKTDWFSHLPQLKSMVQGEIILPNDIKNYNEARRRPYNIDQWGYPLIIVRVKSTSDVSSCLKFIKLYSPQEKVCIASGCHSSRCMQTGSFVIDLKDLNFVHVNTVLMTVAVGGGAYLKAVDEALKPHNFGVTVGTYPETGIGGLTLAGGYGWLARKYGLTVDSFIEAEVVLVDGTIVIANDQNEYSDLIWGLRGGGGNFGVVTKFTLRVHKLPPHAFGGFVTYFAPTINTAKIILNNFDKLAQVILKFQLLIIFFFSSIIIKRVICIIRA
jgi:FAD/FMN-containing dehydrogenase